MDRHADEKPRRSSAPWGRPLGWVVLAVALLAGLTATLSAIAHGGDSKRAGSRPSVGAVATAPRSSKLPAPDAFRPGVVIVGFRSGVTSPQRYAIEHAVGGHDATFLGPPIKHTRLVAGGAARAYIAPLTLQVPSSQVLAIARRLRRNPNVAYAEPDYLMHADAAPNDPSFSLQWAPSNTGQSVPAQGAEETLGSPAPGTQGADDRALPAWGVTTGSSSIVIGEADTGIEYTHPDLAANIWSNPGTVGGCAAGTHGYNVLTATCNPMDDDTYYGGHGTHVAGIMGAVGNNSVGVAGMNWQTTLLPVKWLNSSAGGSTSGLIAALKWLVAAKQEGVNIRVVNDSATFYGTAYSEALREEIDVLGANNILFVTAAGNTGNNNDEEAVRRYPCGYDRPNEICVTATDHNDQLPSWANYGSKTVNLAAPGVSIYSTLRGGTYGYLTGGSMASPQVAGAAALILSVKPTMTTEELRSDILNNVDPLPSLAGKVITGGRLDVCKALPGCKVSEPPVESTFGKTTIGASTDGGLFSNYKIVHSATLSVAGSVTRLRVYAVPGLKSPSPQVLKAVIYADSAGSPGALVATGTEVTYNGKTNGSGWFDLPLASPVKLAAGTYWLGFITGETTEGMGYRYDSVANSRAFNVNTYASGPTNPFGSPTKDAEQASIYALYTAESKVPVNTAAPTITGTAQQSQTLTEHNGTWTNEPTSYSYQWQRCDTTGANCSPIAGAKEQTYTLGSADVGSTFE